MIPWESLASLGVGGILGLIIFFMYRADVKGHIKILEDLVKNDQKSRERNTEVLTELVTLLRRLNGKH